MRIFIGFDNKESIAYHVLSHSIMRHSSIPLSITPLYLPNIKEFTRPKEQQSTEFTFSRFLVPYLSGYEGWSLFMDSDMLCRTDLTEIVKYQDTSKNVSVVKHDYIPKKSIKFLGNAQVSYPRKNWSSLMIFNNRACQELTSDYVNNATAQDLHRFEWADSIGDIPTEWNWLVGEYDYLYNAKLVHFTNGTPCFKEYASCDYAQEWHNERFLTTFSIP